MQVLGLGPPEGPVGGPGPPGALWRFSRAKLEANYLTPHIGLTVRSICHINLMSRMQVVGLGPPEGPVGGSPGLSWKLHLSTQH
eukprot:12707904-Heterocapsa_arctica.AAC.1